MRGRAFGDAALDSPHSRLGRRGIPATLMAATATERNAASVWGGRASGDAALDPPHSRLGRRRTQTTPGFRLGLYEAAASLLDKDGLWATLSQATYANRRIRGSPLTHDTARG